MRKGIADLHRRAEVSKACNNRYLDALATLDTTETLSTIIQPVCQRVRHNQRSVRALQPWTKQDILLLSSVNRGEFNLNGFSNKDIIQYLFPHPFSSPQDKNKASAKVTRLISLLRFHGLIKKITKQYRYRVTPKGQKIINAILLSQNITTQQLNEIAA